MRSLLGAALLGLLALGTGCTAARTTTEQEWTPDRFDVPERRLVVLVESDTNRIGNARHRVNALVGGTTDNRGGFTLGANYEYLLRKELGVAGFADLTFGSPTQTALGAGVWWHPADRWNILAGPGVELGGGTDVFLRVGVGYDFPWQEYLLSPFLAVDVFAPGTPVMLAFSFGRKF